MSRWICIDNICIPSDENDWYELVAFADAVAEQEPIDLVRCGECKWGKPYSDKQLECDALGLSGLKFPNDFCSYGERRERVDESVEQLFR